MSAVIIEEPKRATPVANGEVVSAAPLLVDRPPVAPMPPRRRRKPVVISVLLVAAVVGATFAALAYVHASHFESTDDAYIEGHVVTISPQVSARVLSVNIDDNTPVKRGDVMVQLDPTDYQVALDQATATAAAMAGKLDQARTEISSARASRDEAEAEVHVAEANAANAHADYDRYVELQKKDPGAVSKMQFDQATAAENGNLAQVEQARAKLARVTSDIKTKTATAKAAEGDLNKARADVHKAEVNLSYCTIVAPEAGRVTRKSVEPGSYVQTGEQLFALVPTHVWVVANFKETQLDRMRQGQAVTIGVDAYPGMELRGHVDSFQRGTGSRFSVLPAENATGNFVKVVQRLPVKIDLDGAPGDNDHPLSPGMSVEPEVELR